MNAFRRGTTNVNVDLGKFSPNEVLRLGRLARELRLTDQILSVDLDTVTIQDDGPAPAWTSLEGDHVGFAMSKMPVPNEPVDVAIWLGTNAHELGHVLFTPRRNSLLIRRILGAESIYPNMARLHNILEDQRQERLILGKFSPWRAYLTAALSHHLSADSDNAWLLMAGRTWLPDSVRFIAKERFVKVQGQWMADEVVKLIGDYQHLADPGEAESDRAWEILLRLYELLGSHVPTKGHVCTVAVDGEPDTEPGAPGGDMPDSADEAPEPQPGGDGDGDADGAGDGMPGPTSERPSPKDGGAGSGAGDRSKPPPPLNDKELEKALKEALKEAAKDQLKHDREAHDDLASVLDALNHGGRGADSIDGAMPEGRKMDPTDSARMLHREVADALLDLKDASEPAWIKRVDSGRLNVRRLVFGRQDAKGRQEFNPEQLFDRYEPGQMDAAELEVVLLLDVSGSMNSRVSRLAEAQYAIHRAVDDLEGRITVMAYEAGPHQVLVQPGQRSDGRMFVPVATGGTQPLSALREAWQVLGESQARNRLLVILTDGSWYTKDGDRLIAAMADVGIVTVMALLGGTQGDAIPMHGCEYGERIKDPLDLARLFRGIAATRIRSWL